MNEPCRVMKIAAQLGDENYTLRLALEQVLTELQSQQGSTVTYTLFSVQKCKVLIQEALNEVNPVE